MYINVDMKPLLVILITLACVFIALMIFFVIYAVVTSRRNNKDIQAKMILLSILFVAVAAASYLLNMGWLRVILLIKFIPIIQSIAFFITNLCVSTYLPQSKKLRTSNIVFYITYILGYLLLPDTGDSAGGYVFFAIIHNYTVVKVCYSLCAVSSLVHSVTFVYQIIQIIKLKTIKKRGVQNAES